MIDYKDLEPQLRGLWPEIFTAIGLKIPKMRGKNSVNHPCPLCGGDDRAHWREQNGRLALFCRSCAADSMHSPETVYREVTGTTFGEMVTQLAGHVCHVPIGVRAKISDKRKVDDAAEIERRARSVANDVARYMAMDAGDVGASAYLINKHIDGILYLCKDIKRGRDDRGMFIAIPLYRLFGDGEIVGIQRIYDEKFTTASGKETNKLYTFGMDKSESKAVYIIGDPETAGVIYAGEGFATCASAVLAHNSRLVQSMGYCAAVVGLDSGHMKELVADMVAHGEKLCCLIDHDKPDKNGRRAGHTVGDCIHEIDSRIRMQIPSNEGSDFNDLHVESGLDAVVSALVSPGNRYPMPDHIDVLLEGLLND